MIEQLQERCERLSEEVTRLRTENVDLKTRFALLERDRNALLQQLRERGETPPPPTPDRVVW